MSTQAIANCIKRYRPAYFSGFDEEIVSFTTWEELMEIPWVKNFARDDMESIFVGFELQTPGMIASHDGFIFALYKNRSTGEQSKYGVGYIEHIPIVIGDRTHPRWDQIAADWGRSAPRIIIPWTSQGGE